MRILLAEDDDFLVGGISIALRDSGYSVDHVMSGPEADFAVNVSEYDLLILDLGLPKLDGLDVLKNLRARGQSIPVLILTARDSVEDRVKGLDLGANDYLTKPFDLTELEARIRALTRKERWGNKMEMTVGPVNFDVASRSVKIADKPIELTSRELTVFEIILQNSGRVVTKRKLSEQLSNWDIELSDNAVQIIMHRLRKKLEPNLAIRTVRGVGYICDKPEQ